jgi:hypothetical protein
LQVLISLKNCTLAKALKSMVEERRAGRAYRCSLQTSFPL